MGRQDYETETLIPTIGGGFDVAHTLRREGFDASEDGSGRGTPLVPIAFGWQNSSQQGASASASASNTPTLDKSKVPAIGFDLAQITSKVNRNRAEDGLPQPPIVAGGSPHVASTMQVRRLTPRECERLQGFPDDYTLVQHRNKPAKDGPRYKALGNSMAVPVMAWIGRRIAMVSELETQS